MPAEAVVAPVPVRLELNGRNRYAIVAPSRRLLSVLRDDMGLTGTKSACEVGVCGACTVLVDGRPASSCLMLAVEADGRSVLTVEGLGAFPELERLQRAFVAEGAFQCGYCTSGQLMGLASLVLSGRLGEMDDGQLRDYLLGNLCRCTGYYGILRAVAEATA